MRAALVILTAVIAIPPASAETPGRLNVARLPPSSKVLPLKSAPGANPCAVYGAGFVSVEGTCVKIGGSVDVQAAGSSRR